MHRSFLLSISFLLPAFAAPSIPLTENAIAVRATETVFEVAVQKPIEPDFRYDRALPFDQLPFRQRTDSLISIGSAFAIGTDTLVSAAHVFAMGPDRSFGKPYLRTSSGKVLAIGEIIKYSNHRDFIMFRVPGLKVRKPLVVRSNPEVNETVWAVGNALGDGIIQRNGLLTSRTPEEENGEWNWLRFSAAASPGNSGGPLLDDKGRVIGVVLRKSPNENLNFALPMQEILKAPEKSAVYHARLSYVLRNMPTLDRRATVDRTVSLPMNWESLDSVWSNTFEQWCRLQIRTILDSNRTEIFPLGKSGGLYSTPNAQPFVRLIQRGSDERWGMSRSEGTRSNEIGNGGKLEIGQIGNMVGMLLTSPDDISLDSLVNDSRVVMDLILKGFPLPRQIAGESRRILSMGKAVRDTTHTDRWGRTWLVREWDTPWDDQSLLSFQLPVPGGLAILLDGGSKQRIRTDLRSDLECMTNFVALSLRGNYRQWKEYLSTPLRLPTALRNMQLESNATGEYTLKTSEFSVKIPATARDGATPEINLLTGFVRSGDSTRWAPQGVILSSDAHSSAIYRLARFARPTSDQEEQDRSDWMRLTRQIVPFDGISYESDATTSVSALHPQQVSQPANQLDSLGAVWSLSVIREGKVEPKKMKSLLEEFGKGVTLSR